jgi:hypothetical protein
MRGDWEELQLDRRDLCFSVSGTRTFFTDL